MSSDAGPTLPHRSVTSIRSAPTQNPGPSTPHTPNRGISNTYGSPSTIRADDDFLVLEIGSRLIRAGFAGDSVPKAVLSCGPNDQRRVGDFRAWLDTGSWQSSAWSSENEIWQSDLRDLDLGLVRDKLDRLLREAFTKYLLIDSRPRRLGLVLDSSVPIPLLSTVLDNLFHNFHTPIVSLMSSATMCTAAAGVRSALVVNIGWSETVVTSVYEYREVKSTRTIRGGRLLHNELYKMLKAYVTEDGDQESSGRAISFDECEDIMCRLMWCRSSTMRSPQRQSTQLDTVEEQDESAADDPQSKGAASIPFRSTASRSEVEVPFDKFADVCDDTFFDPSAFPSTFDDHEQPLHLLVYRHLLQLPMDVRAICMARILFTGGCSGVLGIKERVMDEVSSIVNRRGWTPVTGKGVDQLRNNARLQRSSLLSRVSDSAASSDGGDESTGSRPVSMSTQAEDDAIEAKLTRNRPVQQQLQGQLRAIHSLGPWAGASLLCQLKVPAMATIDRELWLQQGANGASRPNEIDAKAQQRQSMGAGGLIRGSGGHHTNWTLGAWGAM